MDTSAEAEILGRLIDWAERRQPIRAVLLTSTRAIPEARVDALSDYDVILVVENILPFVSDRSWLEDFDEVLVAYWGPVRPDPIHGIETCGNVTQYSDGLKIDFGLWPVALFEKIAGAPALPAELDAGYKILLDKDRLTASLLPPTFKGYIPKPPTEEEYLTHINDFLTDAPYVAKCLWRDELLPAKWCLDYDMKHIYLRRMLEWKVETEYGWAIPVGALGKGLKKHISLDLWTQLEQSFAGARLAENWKALFRTMEIFRQAGVEVGQRLGYAYPEELHRRVERYVRQLQRMPRGEAERR